MKKNRRMDLVLVVVVLGLSFVFWHCSRPPEGIVPCKNDDDCPKNTGASFFCKDSICRVTTARSEGQQEAQGEAVSESPPESEASAAEPPLEQTLVEPRAEGDAEAILPEPRDAAEVRPEVQPEIRPEVQPEIRPEVQPEIRPEVRAEVAAEGVTEASSCPKGQTFCGGLCVETALDPLHCGGCNKACGTDQFCRTSGCRTLPYVEKFVRFRKGGKIRNDARPNGLAFDTAGHLYVSDPANHFIYKLTPADRGKDVDDKVIFAGDGSVGSKEHTDGTKASFSSPQGLAYNPTGFLYVADTGSHKIRRINLKTSEVSLYGGSGTPGMMDGASTAAQFNGPRDVAYDTASGILYVADALSNKVRKIDITAQLNFQVTTVKEFSGLAEPSGLTVSLHGVLFVADSNKHRILYQDLQTSIPADVLAGGMSGYADLLGSQAKFDLPRGLLAEPTGTPKKSHLFVVDENNHCIRLIEPNQAKVSTFAGVGKQNGYMNGEASQAKFNKPIRIASDKDGNLYVTDSENSEVRVIWRKIPSP